MAQLLRVGSFRLKQNLKRGENSIFVLGKQTENKHVYLVGGLEHEFYFPFHIWDVIIPIDELHHFSEGVGIPPIIELDDGKIYRKALYLMVKTMVSCKFSLKPIQ